MSRQPAPACRGFALIEVLIALTLVALALLLVIQLLVLDERTLRRRDAQQEVIETLESTIELLRAGRLPPSSEHFTSGELGLLLDRSLRPMTVQLEVTPHSTVANLWEVTIEATYLAGVESQRRRFETRIWRPL